MPFACQNGGQGVSVGLELHLHKKNYLRWQTGRSKHALICRNGGPDPEGVRCAWGGGNGRDGMETEKMKKKAVGWTGFKSESIGGFAGKCPAGCQKKDPELQEMRILKGGSRREKKANNNYKLDFAPD